MCLLGFREARSTGASLSGLLVMPVGGRRNGRALLIRRGRRVVCRRAKSTTCANLLKLPQCKNFHPSPYLLTRAEKRPVKNRTTIVHFRPESCKNKWSPELSAPLRRPNQAIRSVWLFGGAFVRLVAMRICIFRCCWETP